jgi:hypothetical protein
MIMSHVLTSHASHHDCSSEVIKKTPYKFAYAAFTLSFFSSLSFCRLSALITIKEVYAHAAAIQKIIRSMKAA